MENPESLEEASKKTRGQLVSETKKWLAKLEKKAKNVKSTGRMGEKDVKNVIKNMNAYISDCRHFMKKGDWVRAYEAVIYAWGILETCEHLGLVETE